MIVRDVEQRTTASYRFKFGLFRYLVRNYGYGWGETEVFRLTKAGDWINVCWSKSKRFDAWQACKEVYDHASTLEDLL